jgi:predicted HicB family RNase H-like nuclease
MEMKNMAQLTLRLPDDIHTKMRVLAAFKNISQNDLLIEATQALLDQWELKHGALPLPPKETD